MALLRECWGSFGGMYGSFVRCWAEQKRFNGYGVVCMSLWRKCRALLAECRALLAECRALLGECRALLAECRALLAECRTLLGENRAIGRM